MPQFEKDPNEIGVLWNKTSAKGEYMSGVINGQPVVVFKIKSASDRAPDWQVLKAKPKAAPAERTGPEDDLGF